MGGGAEIKERSYFLFTGENWKEDCVRSGKDPLDWKTSKKGLNEEAAS